MLDKISYGLGLSLGQQLKSSGVKELAYADLAAGIQDMLEGNQPKVSFQEAQQAINKFFAELEEKASVAAKAANRHRARTLRGYVARRNSVRQQLQTRRAYLVPAERRYSRLDGRFATDVCGLEVQTVYTLSPRLRRARCRGFYPAVLGTCIHRRTLRY